MKALYVFTRNDELVEIINGETVDYTRDGLAELQSRHPEASLWIKPDYSVWSLYTGGWPAITKMHPTSIPKVVMMLELTGAL